MDNKQIIRVVRHLISLMELHGENDYKVKSYGNAVFNIERFSTPLVDCSLEEILKIKNVGESIAKVLHDIAQTGTTAHLDELTQATPEGVLEMLEIKGVGAKKIRMLWQEQKIENVPQLLDAINQGKLASIKGFGAKTQENIKEALLYKEANRGKLLYAQAESLANQLLEKLQSEFDKEFVAISGEIRRKMEIVNAVVFVIGTSNGSAAKFLDKIEELEKDLVTSGPFVWRGIHKETSAKVEFHLCDQSTFSKTLMLTTGSSRHLGMAIGEGKNLREILLTQSIKVENDAYAAAGLSPIPPELREGQFEFQLAAENKLPQLVEMSDLRGILHNHSTYSDGKNSLEEMALYCQELGYEYLGISDHSKSAYYYANGLYEERVQKQHEEIDELNKKLAPFKIFKGIESDILVNGDLDYEKQTLETFDFIVASIHSSLSMDRKKATERLITAISNPYTTILGHLTGRILLARDGYPIDHKAIIEACAKHEVIIEINSHPNRLDLDWRWVHHAIDNGVMLSLNPDAHEKAAFHHMYYGLCAGRKGGLTKEKTFNTLSVQEVEAYFKERKERALARAAG